MPTPKCRMDMLGILLNMVAKLIPSVGTSTSTAEKWTLLVLTIALVLLLALELLEVLSVLVQC